MLRPLEPPRTPPSPFSLHPPPSLPSSRPSGATSAAASSAPPPRTRDQAGHRKPGENNSRLGPQPRGAREKSSGEGPERRNAAGGARGDRLAASGEGVNTPSPPGKVLGGKGGPGPATAGMVMTSSDDFDRTWNRGWDRQADSKSSLGRPGPRPGGEDGETATKGRGNEGNPEAQSARHSSAVEGVTHSRAAAGSGICSEDMVAERLMTPKDEFDRAWDKSWQRERLKGIGASRNGRSASAGDKSSTKSKVKEVVNESGGGPRETSTRRQGDGQRHASRDPRDEVREVCMLDDISF